MPTYKCPHCNNEINPGSILASVVTPAKIAANTLNAKKPRPGARGPRKAKEVSE